MTDFRILIVEDDPAVCLVLTQMIVREGHRPDVAIHGLNALRLLTENRYDLVLLDLFVEPVGGLEVLKLARQQDPDIVGIIITGHSSLESAVEALRLGAFDYILKPFAVNAVARRVSEGLQHRAEAVRRRRLIGDIDRLRRTLQEFETETETDSDASVTQGLVRSGDLSIDPYRRTATLGERSLNLTTTEFDMLVSLVRSAPAALSPRELIAGSLGYESSDAEARELVKWHVYQLRRKLEPDPSNPRYIKNVRYKGYVWVGS